MNARAIPPSTPPANARFEGRSFERLQPGDRVLVITSPALVRHLLEHEYGSDPDKGPELRKALIGILDATQANPALGVFEGTVTETGDQSDIGLHRVNTEIATGAAPVLETEDLVTRAIGGPLQAHAAMPAVPVGLGGDSMLEILGTMLGTDPDAFERDHPWFTRVGLSTDERNTMLVGLTDGQLIARLKEMGPDGLEILATETPGLAEGLNALEAAGARKQMPKLLVAALRASVLRKPAARFQVILPDDPANRRLVRETFRGFIAETESTRQDLARRYARLS